MSMHSPRRDGRVRITADQPWEKDCHGLGYSSGVKDRGKIRGWYRADPIIQDSDFNSITCYAESDDGIHWSESVPNMCNIHIME